jgi:choline monooxygenase
MDIRANWKVVIENGLECYHCPVNHPGLSQVIHVEEDAFTLFAEDQISIQRGPARPLLSTYDIAGTTYDPRGEVTASQVFHLWPYFTLNTWPGRENMYILLFVPISADRTRVITDWFFPDEVSDEEARGMIEFLNEVGREDQRVVELAHEGLAATFAPPGRLLPKSEQLIHWFQRLVAEALEADVSTPAGASSGKRGGNRGV